MQEEKHMMALEEVKTAISEALKDPKGLLSRQRLLMAALSIGIQHLIELWLHKSKAIKPGALVKHEWFGSEKKKLKIKMIGVLTKNIDDIKDSSKILTLAREVERDRNDIIYGSPLTKDTVLREKMDYFLELKKAIEESLEIVLW